MERFEMSSHRRPWYPWYPKDFNSDEKVRMLSDDAELLYRRALDILWQASDLQMPSNCLKLAKALARGWSIERFESAWDEIQTEGFELLKTTEDGKWVYSNRLKLEAEKIENICNIRREAAKKGGQANAKQMLSKCQANAKQMSSHTDTDTDTDNNNIIVETDEKKADKCPYQKIKDIYHLILPDLPEVRVLSQKRRSQIKARWISGFKLNDGTPVNSLEFWERLFNYVKDSDFLTGKIDPKNGHQRFFADLEWITKESNFIKIIEGKYHGS